MRMFAAASAILLLAACSAEQASAPQAHASAAVPAAAREEVPAATTPDPHDHSGHDHAAAPESPEPSSQETLASVVNDAAAKAPATAGDSVVRRKPATGNLADTVADPFQFENPEVRETYQNAKLVADRLDKMYCYCRCKENEQLAHESLLTCFQDDHAAQCGICLREAQQAFLDFRDDLPIEVTRKAVDLMYNQGNPPPSAHPPGL